MESQEIVLQVKNLNTYFKGEEGKVQALKGISFQARQGETMAIVGESGCGKSLTSLSIMGLTARNCIVQADSIAFENRNLLEITKKEWRQLRGGKMSMIFQEPLTSLNPLFTIGFQLEEAIREHNRISRKRAKEQSVEMLKKVEIPRPERIMSEYPNALSGGMRQRVMIAMAMANNPKLLIADEPTTALDVTIQAQILCLMRHLMKEYKTSIIFITHDFGVVSEIADQVIVMYAGQIVEEADVMTLFQKPLHPYTQGLMNSTIKIDQQEEVLPTIQGTVPELDDMPEGCRFHPRCPYATENCRMNSPELISLGERKRVRCFRYAGEEGEKGDA